MMIELSRRNLMTSTAAALAATAMPGIPARAAVPASGKQAPGVYRSVSYTHLTLPTIYSV